MIWTAGRIVADDALAVSVLDRTFEHGLGLFETLRTWQGRALLLERHLERMARSARTLGIPLDAAALPDDGSVTQLVKASEMGADVLIRITLTGGLSPSGGSTLWMRAGPLPPPLRRGAVVDVGPWQVTYAHPLARHKTLNYWERRLVSQNARVLGFDEVLGMSPGDRIWEGSRTNVFVVLGDELVTPSAEGPIVPGIMRELVQELASASSLAVSETDDLCREFLAEADEVFLTNSVRGIIPVARVRDLAWEAPGPCTERLQLALDDWLSASGRTL